MDQPVPSNVHETEKLVTRSRTDPTQAVRLQLSLPIALQLTVAEALGVESLHGGRASGGGSPNRNEETAPR